VDEMHKIGQVLLAEGAFPGSCYAAFDGAMTRYATLTFQTYVAKSAHCPGGKEA
jgi:hypothetical protein